MKICDLIRYTAIHKPKTLTLRININDYHDMFLELESERYSTGLIKPGNKCFDFLFAGGKHTCNIVIDDEQKEPLLSHDKAIEPDDYLKFTGKKE